MKEARYFIGQVVKHRLFGYRGVVFDADSCFEGTDEWYDNMARSLPPKDEPWYRVLVHNGGYETYVAERNLAPDDSGEPVEHPLVEVVFGSFQDGKYYVTREPH